MINCTYYRIRTKKGIKYQYCTKLKREIPKNGCYGCVDKENKIQYQKKAKNISKNIIKPLKKHYSEKHYSKKIKIPKKVTRKKTVSDSTYQIVLARDNYKCRLCGNDNRYELELHHIYYRSQSKDLIDEPDNCIMLCGNFSKNKCHMKVHNNKKKYQPLLLEIVKNTKKN